MRTRDEIERIKERIDALEKGYGALKEKGKVSFYKDKDEFDGHGDCWRGLEMGWKEVDVNAIVKIIFNHLNLKYISESTVPASVVKKSK